MESHDENSAATSAGYSVLELGCLPTYMTFEALRSGRLLLGVGLIYEDTEKSNQLEQLSRDYLLYLRRQTHIECALGLQRGPSELDALRCGAANHSCQSLASVSGHTAAGVS